MQLWILYLLFFSLPFQIRLLLVGGVNEYQSVFLYGTDILIALLFFTAVEKRRFSSPLFLPALLLIGWLLLSSIFSQNPLLGFYRTVKIAEFFWLFFYLLLLSRAVYANALKILVASGLFQSVLAIGQFATQHDLGLRVLGENILAPDITGVAKIDVFGEKFIRAYGTFPHPNVLAVFLLFCIFLLFLLVTQKKTRTPIPHTLYPIPFLILALLLTFSRAVIVIGILSLILWFLFSNDRPWHLTGIFLLSFFVFGSILFPLLKERASLSLDDQAIALRLAYMENALKAIREYPILGAGPGQFTSFQQPLIKSLASQPWANQPVHNIYLLLASEAGIPALFFFCWFLATLFRSLLQKPQNFLFIIPYSLFLILALFDHFFLTFQQGALTFWTSLAFSSYFSPIDKKP
ncbi:MAG: O-antigen ligase family protein [Candidatus Portnoybacteria bacterium]|nr:O-antigen ligase family protein [Candidatus Portnoybacteria bacterium]